MPRLSVESEGNAAGVMSAAILLMAVGVIMVASTSASLERSLLGSLSWGSPLVRQALTAAVGVVLMIGGARLGPDAFRWRSGVLVQPSLVLLLFSLGLLAAVWLPYVGKSSHGRHRWIDVGPFGFQPSELAKVALVVFLAAALTRCRRPGAAPGTWIPMVSTAAVCGLIGLEDFGTAVLLVLVGGLMMLVGGCRLASLVAWALPAAGGLTLLLFTHPYRMQRLMSFLNIWDDPRGAGYHPIQSLAAIASGGWTGRGLGAGVAKFGYLPECRTDFVFAVICEETGVLGATMVLGAYAALIGLGWRIVRSAGAADGGFGRLFAFGVTLLVGLQALLNIAVVTVVAPTKGIALPMVSAGGSSLVCFAMAVGLLAGVGARGAGRLQPARSARHPALTVVARAEGGAGW